MAIIDKNEINHRLDDYYKTIYGDQETDKWFEQPVANVWVFKRDGKIIT